jgi:hypothetical protein
MFSNFLCLDVVGLELVLNTTQAHIQVTVAPPKKKIKPASVSDFRIAS